MTQEQLAQAVEMPQPSIARIERGTVTPRTATLIALLDATGHRLSVEPIGPVVDRGPIQQRLVMSVPKRTRQALGSIGAERRKSPIHILSLLRRFGVPFVLIGDLAEVAHGSPTKVGAVIEVVHGHGDVAEGRIALALKELRASSIGDIAYRTDAGQLHLHAETAAGDDYQLLARNAKRTYVDAGVLVRVAAIDDLIRARQAGSTPEDQHAAAVLRAVADELHGAPDLAS